jgi:serine phosphatase RsbU (regulator of sigma subunit)
VCLIIGDAAGKGVTAATTVSALRHVVRYFGHRLDDPGDALQAANEAFLLGFDRVPDIATICFVIVGPDGSVRISLAGHLPPLRIGASDASLLEGAVDPPIGLATTARRSFTAQLVPGDGLVLFTDGLVERRREPLDRALERLVGAGAAAPGADRSAAGVVDRLMQELAHDATDDVAILAVTFSGARADAAGP